MPKPRVVVAMSGGVDSSVAAGLLVREGYEVIGITMRLWTQDDPEAARHHKRCCSVEDTSDAQAAADTLGIRHYVLNLEREFAEDVVDRFVQEYARGRTPNPCLSCNDKVKFRPLLDHAVALGANYLATGHYARVEPPLLTSNALLRKLEGFSLLTSVDPAKDQSYVLYTLGQDELRRTLFPIGGYTKDEIRALAHEMNLPNADKPDSADICFIPSGDYRAFVRDRVPVAAGNIVDTEGQTVGEHDGIANYTIGQRRGLPARGDTEPIFVVDIDPDDNRVVVGPHEMLMSHGLIAEDLTWINGAAPGTNFQAEAKIRYRSEPVASTVTLQQDTADSHECDEPPLSSFTIHHSPFAKVSFARPQRAVTPGQAVVFYKGDRVLGGGTIVRRAD